MNLLELQRRMSEDVQRPLTADFEMQPETDDGRYKRSLLRAYVKPNDRLTSFERLEIYNRQYWFRVIGAVSEDFPALAQVLGAKRFDALVLAYLKENPSTSFTLRNLGARCRFGLQEHPEFCARDGMHCCWISPDWSGLTSKALTGLLLLRSCRKTSRAWTATPSFRCNHIFNCLISTIPWMNLCWLFTRRRLSRTL